MAIVLNRSTQILIDNFVSTFFSNIPSENKAKIKESVVEIADSILEQSNADLKDLDKLATKGDIVAIKNDVMSVKNDMDKMKLEFNNKITETKYDIVKWIITAQVAIAGLMVVVISLTLSYFKVI